MSSSGADAEMKPAEEEPSQQAMSFDLLQLLKKSQAQHGLRQGDYARYRQYCARRLRRLYKGLKFLHGRKKFENVILESHKVKEERHLHIPLLNAERAWSCAMELKKVGEGNPRVRQHLVRRLRKAARWASELAALASELADPRTALETEAYASWMSGTLHFEQEKDWTAALAKFIRSKTVYEELCKVGSVEQQGLCRERVEELEPSIRYCQYNINQSGGGGVGMSDLAPPSPSKTTAAAAAAGHSPAQDLLQSKLAALRAAERAKQAEVSQEVNTCLPGGITLQVANAAVRLHLLKAQDLLAQLQDVPDTEFGQKEKVFDKVFLAYNDAKALVREDIARLTTSTTDQAAREKTLQELSELESCVTVMLVQQTLTRNHILLASYQAKLEKHSEDREQKAKVKAEDMVKLCDNLLTALAGLSDSIASSPGDDVGTAAAAVMSVSAECEVQQYSLKGWRALYLAQCQKERGSAAAAYLLYGAAVEHARGGLAKSKEGSEEAQQSLQNLLALSRREKLEVHTEEVLAQSLEEEALGKGVSSMGLDGAAVHADSPWLLDNLSAFRSFGGTGRGEAAHLLLTPPPFQPVPAGPIVLDTALNEVDFPSLDARVKSTQQSKGLSRFFGWGRS